MIRPWIVALALAGLPSVPALAQQVVQPGSNIALPAQIDGMPVTTSTGGFGDLGTSYDYRGGGDLIQILIYRATYPSVALWFEQGEKRTSALFERVTLDPDGPAETFATRSRNPNGMRRFYKVSAPFASTAIAVVSFGGWIASIRSSSKTMDVAQQRSRVNSILEQIIAPAGLTESRYPVVPIADCGEAQNLTMGPMGQEPLEPVTLEMKTSGGLGALLASQSAFAGDRGVAAEPAKFCRRQTASQKTTWFESLDPKSPSRWIVPVSETGMTVEAMLLPAPGKGGAIDMVGVLITNEPERSNVRAFYRELPFPVTGQLRALTALTAGLPPYATVKHGTREIGLGQ